MQLNPSEQLATNRAPATAPALDFQAGFRYHAKAWAIWLLAALVPTILTQNPFYLLLIILSVSLNYFSLDRTSPTAQGWGVFLRLGIIMVAFRSSL